MNVRFFAGTRAQYDSLPSPRNVLGLYFCSDTRELFWGDLLLTDGTRMVATEAGLPRPELAADGITYFVEETRNGYVVSADRTRWVKIIQAAGASCNADNEVKAISFAGIEMEEVDGVFTIDRRCAREALGFIVPDGLEDEELEIVTKEYVDSQIAKIPGADLDLDEYVKQEDITHLVTKEELKEAIDAIDCPTADLTGYATEQWVREQRFLTEHQDLSEYAKKTDIPSVNGFAPKSYVDEKFDSITIPEVPTKVSELENDAGYITLAEVPKVDLGDLATKTFVEEAIAKAELSDKEVDLTNYATKTELEQVEAKIPSVDGLASKVYVDEKFAEMPAKVSELENDAGYITAAEVPQVDLTDYAKKSDIPDTRTFVTKDDLQETIASIEQSTELYIVDFNAPSFADAVEAYNNGKLLLLTNAAPDVNSYAMMNYVNDKYITFTKFLISRSETYGSFNTYYLRRDNSWEIADEVRVNRVEAITTGTDGRSLTGITIGKEEYNFNNYATTASVNEINQSIENIENTYVTSTALEEKNYVTEQYVTTNYITQEVAQNTYVTNEQVNEVVTNEVQTVVTEQIETKVETVIQEKVNAGEISVNADAINYDTW